MTKQFENYYVKSVVGMLDVPIPVEALLKTDEEGEIIPDEYYTIREYEALFGHTIDRISNDGEYFVKGFQFNYETQDAIREKVADYALVFGYYGDESANFIYMNHNEAMEELAKPEWTKEEV